MKPVNHYNGHRANKRRIDISVTPEEGKLVDRAKKAVKAVNNKDLLLKLCNHVI